MGEAITTAGCERGNILEKIWERNDHNKKGEWINYKETELRMLEEGPLVNIHPERLKSTLKKIGNWKTPGLIVFPIFGFKNSPPYTTDLLPK